MQYIYETFRHDWRHTVNQITEGQITVYPRPGLRQYLGLINDPSIAEMTHYIEHGKSITFPFFGMIETRLNLQGALRQHIEELDETLDHSMLSRLLLNQVDSDVNGKIESKGSKNLFTRRMHSVF